ncbi:hypothetical protein ACFU76_36700 [Streptomyces sp. NPDC057539]|uniref:hypothetical protein n=1 Tax=Streptomyces sp. NPDC057539 TaxID=3346159 RepID=UPI00369516B0
MQTADPYLVKALQNGERSADHRIRLGGRDLGTQISSWSLDQSYATDLPDAMRAFAGSSSAQLELTLGGEGGASAPALYGPWAPRASGDVVRPRQSVTMNWGLAGSTLPQFRGTVRSRSAQLGGDTVTLSALDGAERLRMPARLPRPSGGIDEDAPYGPSVANNWTASPTWCVDHLLRNAGIHTCPPPRPTSILYASLHGGAAADIGYLTALSGDWTKWTKTNAPWESAVQGPATGLASAEYAPAVRTVNVRGDGLWAEAWFDNTGSTSGTRQLDLTLSWLASNHTSYYTTVRVDFAKGELQTFSGRDKVPTGNASIYWTIPALTNQSGRWHIGFWLKFSTVGVPTFEARVSYPNGGAMHCTPGTVPAGVVPAAHLGEVILRLGNLRVEGLQVSPLPSVPTTPADILQEGRWTKTAALDAPDTGLRVIPAVTGTAWEAITAIARATLSTADFDGNGIFHWRNRSRWATAPTTSQLTVTSARELASLTVTEEIDACRNHCAVKWDNWTKVKVNKSTYKSSGSKVSIAAGATATLTFSMGDDEYDCPPPHTYADGLPGCIRFTNGDSDTAATVHGVVEVGTVRSDGIVTVTMRNRGTTTVWLRAAGGTTLSIDMLVPSVENSEPTNHWYAAWNTTSQGYYGVQLYEHDPEGWVQDSTAASGIAIALRTAGVYPVPLLQDVEILADPRIQLGDVVRVRDNTGAVLDSLAWVVGIKTEAEGQAIKQTLTLRGAAYNGVPADTGLNPDPPVSGSVT